MSIIHGRTDNSVSRGTVAGRLAGAAVAAALCLGTPILATMAAAPASAEKFNPVVNQDYAIDCPGDCTEKPLTVPFTTTGSSIRVTLTSPGTGTCKRGLAEVSIDGQYHSTRRVGTGWEQEPFTKDLAAGNHTVTVMFRTLSDCFPNAGQVDGIKGHLQVDDVVTDGPILPPDMKLDAPVTVLSDGVEVYERINPDTNEGENILGELNAGTTVKASLACDPEGFCAVFGDAVPGPKHQGFVWFPGQLKH